jgi:hypothetical protein
MPADETTIRLFAHNCRMFIDDSINVITIVPMDPYPYNTEYTIVFEDFPILVPDINNFNGYYEDSIDMVYYNYFKTITPPTYISDISFQRSGDVVWCANEKIEIYFSKPITPNASVLDSMFELIKIGESTTNSNGTLSYALLTMPIDVTLAENQTTIILEPSVPLEYGENYFLSTKLEYYLGDDKYNQNYSFRLPSSVVLDVAAQFPAGDSVPPVFRLQGYDGQRSYLMGDTAVIGFPTTIDKYYLAEWILPNGVSGELSDDGKYMTFIFDCEHFFRDALGNPDMNNIKTGIKVTAKYAVNPIDTLVLSVNTSSLTSPIDSYSQLFTCDQAKSKLDDTTFTFYRFSDEPLWLHFNDTIGREAKYEFEEIEIGKPMDDLQSVATTTNIIGLVPLSPFKNGSVVAVGATVYNMGVSGASGIVPIIIGGGSNGKGTVVVKLEENPFKQTGIACEFGGFNIEVNYMGYGGDNERDFEDELTAQPNGIVGEMYFLDRTGQKIQLQLLATSEGIVQVTDSISLAHQLPYSITSPVTVDFNVTLSNPDYEIFLVTTKFGTDKVSLVSMPPVDVVRGTYGNQSQYYYQSIFSTSDYVYDNYKLFGVNHISGVLTAYDEYCGNTLKIYIRRRIVEFQYEIADENFVPEPTSGKRCPNLYVMKLKYFPLLPISFDNLSNRPYNPLQITINSIGYIVIGDYEYRNNGWENFVGYDLETAKNTYLRSEHWYGSGGNSNMESVLKDVVSVYYYSGEGFNYLPENKEASGYNFLEYTAFPNVLHYFDTTTNTVNIPKLQSKDGTAFQSDEAFRLKYIQVTKYKKPVPPNYDVYYHQIYRITNSLADKYDGVGNEVPLWETADLLNPDNGIWLAYLSGTNNPMHNKTVIIRFMFSDWINTSTISAFVNPGTTNNILIDDLDNIGHYGLRPDGNEIASYPVLIEDIGLGFLGGNCSLPGVGTVDVMLYNTAITPNNNGFFQMCNLQPFRITIKNPTDNPILSADGEILSNIKLGERLILDASTALPHIITRQVAFENINQKDIYGGEIEAYMNMFTEIDIYDRQYNLDGTTYDELGRMIFDVKTKRNPNEGEDDYWNMQAGNSYLQNSDILINNLLLKNEHRILHSYHWIDDNAFELWPFGNDCNAFIDLITSAAQLVSILADWSQAASSEIIEAATPVMKSALCSSSDAYLGTTNFWLSNSYNTSLLNSQWRRTDNNNNATEQNWELWGAGRYGLYVPNVLKSSYNTILQATVEASGTYILTSTPGFATHILIMLGN